MWDTCFSRIRDIEIALETHHKRVQRSSRHPQLFVAHPIAEQRRFAVVAPYYLHLAAPNIAMTRCAVQLSLLLILLLSSLLTRNSSAVRATKAAHANASLSTSPARRLASDGLECDLQLYQNFLDSDAGADIFVYATLCESRIQYLKTQRAGSYGPIEQADLRSVMCSSECLTSDALHERAMVLSRCSCAQLSANTCIHADFCWQSSARLLCTHLSECGHWGCALEDFRCLRNEWDRWYACSAIRSLGAALSIKIAIAALYVWLYVGSIE